MKLSRAAIPFAVAGLLFSAVNSAQARTEIQNKGSDTLVNVAQAWAEEYGKINPTSPLPSPAAAPAPVSPP